MSNLSKFTQDYLSYRKPEAGGVSYVERLPAGSDKSGKIHHVLHFRKIVVGQTSVLAKHEGKILDGLANSRASHTVKLLDHQNSLDRQNPQNSTQTIITEAAGVDLCDWFNAPIFINELNRSLDNIYDHPLFALAILKGSLVALEQIHVHNVIHCDIKLDNICLPFSGGNVENGETIQIQLDNITLIDFGVAYWIGNMGDSERIWLGYCKDNERYQSRLLINTLKQWYEDNQGRTSPPYDNSSLTQINYSCDLYSLGVAFECFCQEQQYQQDEYWRLVHTELRSIINELKNYDNGIPSTQSKPPHQNIIQKIDVLIQKVVAYEKTKGFFINPNYANGKLLLSKPKQRKTPPIPTPTPQPLDINKIDLSGNAIPPTRLPPPNNKKSWKKAWIGGGVLLLAMAIGGVMSSNQTHEIPEPALIPDLWSMSYGTGGFLEYGLSNAKNQTIIISCNVSAGEGFDHSFYYYPNGWDPNEEYDTSNITMVLNDAEVVYPPSEDGLPTSTTNGGINWVKFATGLSKATKIDVYSNNELIVTFRPPLENVKEVASSLADCEPVQYHPPG